MRFFGREDAGSAEHLLDARAELDGAIAEYEHRLSHLQQLIAEAEAALAALHGEAREKRASAAGQQESTAFEQQAAEQAEQLELIRQQSTQVAERLAELGRQREAIDAQWNSASSQSAAWAGAPIAPAPRFRLKGFAAALGILVLVGGALMTLFVFRSQANREKAPLQQVAPALETVAAETERNPLDAALPAVDPDFWWQRKSALRQLSYAPRIVSGLNQRVTNLAFQPQLYNNKSTLRMIVGDDGGRAHLLSVAVEGGSPYLAVDISVNPQRVTQVAYARTGVCAAAAHEDGAITIMYIDEANTRGTLEGHTKPVGGLQFSTDGSRLLSASADGTVRLWSIAEERELKRIELDPSRANVRCLSWLEEVDRVLIGSAMERDSLALYSLETGDELIVFETEPHPTIAACLFDGGKQAISAGFREMQVWETTKSRPVRSFGGGFTTAAFTPDGLRAITGNSNHSLTVWDVENGEPLQQLIGHTGPVTSVSIFADGRFASSAGDEGTIRIWNLVPAPGLVQIFEGHTSNVRSVEFFAASNNDRLEYVAVSGDVDGKVLELNFSKEIFMRPAFENNMPRRPLPFEAPRATPYRIPPEVPGTFTGPARPAPLVHFSPTGERFVYVTEEGPAGPQTLRISTPVWRGNAPKPDYRAFGNLEERISVAALSSDTSLVACGCGNGMLWVREVESGREIARLAAGVSIKSLAFSPEKRPLILWGGDDNDVHLWNYETQEEVRKFSGHTEFVRCVQYDLDGRNAVSASADGTVRVWDVASGEVRYVLTGHGAPVNAVAVSPDGKQIVSGSDDTTVRKWDFATGKLLLIFRSHAQAVRCLAISPDNRFLLSGSDDTTVRLWEL